MDQSACAASYELSQVVEFVNIVTNEFAIHYIIIIITMSKSNLAPGHFSRPSLATRKSLFDDKKENVEPNKRLPVDKQGKSTHEDFCQRAVSKKVVDYSSQKELADQVERLKTDNKRLKDKLKLEEEKNTEILHYEMYIKELNESASLQKAKYRSEIKENTAQLRNLQKQHDQLCRSFQELSREFSKVEQTNSKYEKILKQSIMFLMMSFSQITAVKQPKNILPELEKNYVKIFILLNPLIEQWGIEQELMQLQQTQLKQQKFALVEAQICSGNSTCRLMEEDTFRAKEQILSSVSTNKSVEQIHDEKYIQQQQYETKVDYMSSNENHLCVAKGSKIRLLKRTAVSRLWIGEHEDRIGYFPWSILA